MAAAPPVPQQQKLIALDIQLLKNLKDVRLKFDESPLTALMGANGCGKTTVLHALACVYAPSTEAAPDYRFPSFFKPTSDGSWRGSSFQLEYSQREGQVVRDALKQEYAKAADRWTPRYERRPLRYTRLVSIRESVPEVEAFGSSSMVRYQKAARVSPLDQQIREMAGRVLNRQYDEYHNIDYQRGRRSIGVTAGGLAYPALSMSAGEQRVFRILEATFSAPDYALVLIDEIDLFLHQDALQRLLEILHSHCSQKRKQLVMTTHFPPVARMYNDICVTTLHRTRARTVFWSGYSLAALRHITGVQERALSVYVEDDVAEAMVSQILTELRFRPHVQIELYGPASNAFKLGAGLVLANQSLDHMLIVLDGDEQASKPERRKNVSAELTGTEAFRDAQRKSLLATIRAFSPKQRRSPEQVLNQLLHSVPLDGLDDQDKDLLTIAKDVINVPERHGFVGHIVTLTGESRAVALSKLVRLAAKAEGWKKYTAVVRKALDKRRETLNLEVA